MAPNREAVASSSPGLPFRLPWDVKRTIVNRTDFQGSRSGNPSAGGDNRVVVEEGRRIAGLSLI